MSAIKSITRLVTGTAIGQLILIGATPILTRLYVPSDFSSLALYVSILAVVSVVAGFKYELAIPLPKVERHAFGILALALIAVVGTAVAVLGVLLITRYTLLPVFVPSVADRVPSWIVWLLPLGVITAGTYNTFQYWAIRERRYSVIASTKVTQAGITVLVQLLLGFKGLGAFGLSLGHALGGGAGCFVLARKAVGRGRAALCTITIKRLATLAKRYRRFPQFSMLEGLSNNAGMQIPLVLIALASPAPEAGFLFIAMRVALAPMSVLGAAVSQVFLPSARDALAEDRLSSFTLDYLTNLYRYGAGMILGACLFAPAAFPFLLGQGWERAGEIVLWMAPACALQFIVSPVSMSLHLKHAQKAAMNLQIFGVVLRVGAVVSALLVRPEFAVESFAIASGIFYLSYLVVVIRITQIGAGRAAHAFLRAAPLPVAILAAAAFILYAAEHIS